MNFKGTNSKIPLIVDYYNHFNEDLRLQRRHGQVEFNTNMHYILKYLGENKNKKILDIGAGTGAYSIPLYEMGYDVTAIELVEKNIERFKANNPNVFVSQGDALDLSRFNDKSFDFILLFGPMYHLLNDTDKIKALNEAKRVLKDDGVIFVSYYMNDYAVINYGFMKGNIKQSLDEGRISKDFHIISLKDDLYSMVRISDIKSFDAECGMISDLMFASDGPSDYIRPILNRLSEEEFKIFLEYNLSICENQELLGASSHVVDIIRKKL